MAFRQMTGYFEEDQRLQIDLVVDGLQGRRIRLSLDPRTEIVWIRPIFTPGRESERIRLFGFKLEIRSGNKVIHSSFSEDTKDGPAVRFYWKDFHRTFTGNRRPKYRIIACTKKAALKAHRRG